MRFLSVLAAALTLVFATPEKAAAAPITGGSTIVAPTLDLSPFDVALLGSATDGVTFPVTGGDLDASLAGRIEHEGSGVQLSAGGASLALENFIIDTTNGTVFGDVTANGERIADDAALFSFALDGLSAAQITDLTNPMLALNLTGVATGAIDTVFGVSLATGTQFGLAATAPEFGSVPAPGGLALILIAFGGLVARRRRA
jgi:hypothetical protein